MNDEMQMQKKHKIQQKKYLEIFTLVGPICIFGVPKKPINCGEAPDIFLGD
jgi:hypothetical protein